MSLTKEQQEVVNAVIRGKNVIVDAVAGSGKTTTVLGIAKALPNKTIIQVTYNARLKDEVREKVIKAELKNLTVHTYNSLCVQFYDKKGYHNLVLHKVVHNNSPAIAKPNKLYDIVVLDEVQDMTPLFYKLIKRFLKEMCTSTVQLILLGDRLQAIYEYSGADPRFLTMGEQIWDRGFVSLPLHTSFRVTKPIASFVNKCMVHRDLMIAVKEGCKPHYWTMSTQEAAREIPKVITDLIFNKNVNPEEIFILSYTHRSSFISKPIEYSLTVNNVPCYFPSDDEEIDDKVCSGKVVFSTFHQSKGRERPYVFIIGFDDSYFKIDKEANREVCPSVLYVAATRASKKLILINTGQHLPFIKELEEHVIWQGTYITKDPVVAKQKTVSYTTTQLISHLSIKSQVNINTVLDVLFERVEGSTVPIKLKNIIKSKNGLYESVSDINGIAIPMLYAISRTGDKTVLKWLDQILSTKGHTIYKNKAEHLYRTLLEEGDITEVLKLITIWSAMTSGVIGRLYNLTNYSWLKQEQLEDCFTIIDEQVGTNLQFELPVEFYYNSVRLYGIIDIVDDKYIWEIKTVKELTFIHELQLAVYMYLYFHTFGVSKDGKLLNVLTGEVRTLTFDIDALEFIIKILVNAKK